MLLRSFVTDNFGKTVNGLSFFLGTLLQCMESFLSLKDISSGDGHRWSQILRVSESNGPCL